MTTPSPGTSLRPLRTLLWTASLAVSLLGASRGLAAPANRTRPDLWWSLKPVTSPTLPDAAPDASNPIDRFLGAEHRSLGLKAVGPAAKLTLLRRVHLDLTGIPPSPAEQDAFLSDTSPDAYEKLVDQLLDSEQHAVRYARHWLDVLRYADVDEHMPAAPGIHLWRDWVINALHEDLPYDQFVRTQLTGYRSTVRTQMSATGIRFRREPRADDLFALGLLARGAGDDPQDLAISAVETVSSAFMGMTVACAKCHDHRYDPITQRDFYAMKALFDPLALRKVTLASASDLRASAKAAAEAEKLRTAIERPMNELIEPYKKRLYEERVLMLPAEVQSVIRKPERLRSAEEQKIADDYYPILRIDPEKITEILPEADRKKYQDFQKQLGQLGEGGKGRAGKAVPVFFTVEPDRVRERDKSYILTSGDPARPEKNHEVQPGWPFATLGGTVTLPGNPTISQPMDFREGRVEAFSDWLTVPGNPLFARVAVNRLWQWHFGEGLLKTANDFGEVGGKPSNPALLDWLASELVRLDFSMRRMHRLIVTSQAYRRASEAGGDSAANLAIDPDNTRLWHFPLQRLEAEPIWDSIHAAAGNLDLTVGGTSFEIREVTGNRREVAERGPSPDPGPGRKQRAAYMMRGFSTSRDVLSNFLQAFDVDDGRAPCPMRTQTVTAPQALFLMNSREIEAASGELADRLQKESHGDLKAAVDLAYRYVVSRPPSPAETTESLAYLGDDAGRLKQLAWLLFNLDEFLYVR